jgi:hypothetical protein
LYIIHLYKEITEVVQDARDTVVVKKKKKKRREGQVFVPVPLS